MTKIMMFDSGYDAYATKTKLYDRVNEKINEYTKTNSYTIKEVHYANNDGIVIANVLFDNVPVPVKDMI